MQIKVNEIFKETQTTAENIAKYLHDCINVTMGLRDGREPKISVTVWEGEKSAITYSNKEKLAF